MICHWHQAGRGVVTMTMAYLLTISAMMANTSDAFALQGVYMPRTRISGQKIKCGHRSTHSQSSLGQGHTHACISKTIIFVTNDNDDGKDKLNTDLNNKPKDIIDPRRPDKNLPSFMDAMLEIPDPRLLAGDLLFILIINFLLQIADEVGDPEFWMNGGFSQPITMPTTLLSVIVRDSKMSIAWVLGALWNRSYSSSSVSDDNTAVKTALQIWVDYCSLRILLELGESFLFTHSTVYIWLLGREAWYTAIVMAFFRLAYGRYR